MDHRLDGRCHLAEHGCQRFLDNGGEGTAAGARGDRVRGIDIEQDLRSFAACQGAFEAGRYGHNESGLAVSHDGLDGVTRRHGPDQVEIFRGLHRLQDGATGRSGISHLHQGRQIARVCIDGIAEQEELHDGNADHHAEGQAVAQHLDEFLAQNGENAREAIHRKLSSAPVISQIKASSSPVFAAVTVRPS